MKSADAFRTISEVAEFLQTPAHVLRFWESRFPQIKPVKRAGGRRYYRPGDVALLGGIRRLWHDDGLTIRGVQKLLREQGVGHVAALGGGPVAAAEAPDPGATEALVAQALDDNAGHWPATADPDSATGDTTLRPDPDEAPIHIDAPPLADSGSALVTAIGRARFPGLASGAAPPVPRTDARQEPGAEADAAPEAQFAFEAQIEAGLEPDAQPEAEAEPDPLSETMTESEGQGESDYLHLPAAQLLRAMDAVRARDHRDDLRTIYGRVLRLHNRLSAAIASDPAAGGQA